MERKLGKSIRARLGILNKKKQPSHFYYVYVLDDKQRFVNSPKEHNLSLIGVFRNDALHLAKKTIEAELDAQYAMNWFFNGFLQEYQSVDKRKRLGYIKKVY